MVRAHGPLERAPGRLDLYDIRAEGGRLAEIVENNFSCSAAFVSALILFNNNSFESAAWVLI